VCALLTSIFVNRHAANTLPSGGFYSITAAFRAQ
jgi:hypothetical protein